MLFAVSRLLAILHPRYGRLRSHLTLRAFYVCFYLCLLVTTFVLYFCPHFGVGRLHVLNPVNREAVPLVHAFCVFYVLFIFTHTFCVFYELFLFIFTHSSIFRQRVVRNDSLIQRLGRQRSRVVWRQLPRVTVLV